MKPRKLQLRLFLRSAISLVLATIVLISGATGCTSNGRPRPLGRDGREISDRDESQAALTRRLVIAALDSEALYTFWYGLKPMSSGFWRASFQTGSEPGDLARVRAALAPLRDDEFYADVQVFQSAHDGKRHAEAYVMHRAALAAMVEREAPFWLPYGITPSTQPEEFIAVVNRMERADRWRAYGLLYGYPKYAIDFFVQAGIAADERASVRKAAALSIPDQEDSAPADIGPGKDRDFYHIATFASPTGRFTWAVPLGHMERDEDRVLARDAGMILAAYREARAAIVDAADPLETARANRRRGWDSLRGQLAAHAPSCPATPSGATPARTLWGVLATGARAERRMWCAIAGDHQRWTHVYLDLNTDGLLDAATESFAGVAEPGSTRVIFRPPASALGSEHTFLPIVVDETGTITLAVRWRNRAEMSGCWKEGPVGSTPQFAPTPTAAPLIHFDLSEPLDILRYDEWPKAVAGEKFDVNTLIGRRGQGRASFVAASLDDVLPHGAGLEAELRYADKSGRPQRITFPVMQRACSKILFEWIDIPADAGPGAATIRLRGTDRGSFAHGTLFREQTFAIEITELPGGTITGRMGSGTFRYMPVHRSDTHRTRRLV